MKSMSLRCAVLIAVLSLLAACGKGNDNTAVCTQTANMTLFTSSTGSTLLTSITVTAAYGNPVPDVPVWVGYVTPPVGSILAGYPAGGVNPLNYGINIVPDTNTINVSSSNPLEFLITFDASQPLGTYHAVLRFVAANMAFTEPVDCQDVPVTFTVN